MNAENWQPLGFVLFSGFSRGTTRSLRSGTVLHEVLEGRRATGYTADANLAIDGDCKVRVGRLERGSGVRFGLAVTLEVGPEIQVDVHNEVRSRLREQVRPAVQASVRG